MGVLHRVAKLSFQKKKVKKDTDNKQTACVRFFFSFGKFFCTNPSIFFYHKNKNTNKKREWKRDGVVGG